MGVISMPNHVVCGATSASALIDAALVDASVDCSPPLYSCLKDEEQIAQGVEGSSRFVRLRGAWSDNVELLRMDRVIDENRRCSSGYRVIFSDRC